MKYLRPLAVKDVMGPVDFKIEMLSTMKLARNVHHISKLEPSSMPTAVSKTKHMKYLLRRGKIICLFSAVYCVSKR